MARAAPNKRQNTGSSVPNATDNPNTPSADDVLFSSYFGCSSTGEQPFLSFFVVRPRAKKYFP